MQTMALVDALTYSQAAEVLGVSKSRVSQLVAAGDLTPIEVSPGRKFLLKAAVDALAEARRDRARRRFGIPFTPNC